MNDHTNDGGAAHPTYVSIDSPEHPPEYDTFPGMSLRDWFAGQALTGLMYTTQRETERGNHDKTPQNDRELALMAYIIADAMLNAREDT